GQADGSSCQGPNLCLTGQTCQAGVCQGGTAKTCTASDSCHVAGVCDQNTGTCSNPTATDGTTCSDSNACTRTGAMPDHCVAAAGQAGASVTCTASDSCHVAGTCDPSNGTCSTPTAPDGTSCSDANACTQNDTCQAGVCTGGAAVVCTASDAC